MQCKPLLSKPDMQATSCTDYREIRPQNSQGCVFTRTCKPVNLCKAEKDSLWLSGQLYISLLLVPCHIHQCSVHRSLARFGDNLIMVLYSYLKFFINVKKNVGLERTSWCRSSSLHLLTSFHGNTSWLLAVYELLRFPSKYYSLLPISHSNAHLSFSLLINSLYAA